MPDIMNIPELDKELEGTNPKTRRLLHGYTTASWQAKDDWLSQDLLDKASGLLAAWHYPQVLQTLLFEVIRCATTPISEM